MKDMKKTVPWTENAESRKTQRADLPPTDGYTLIVDGHFKNSYADEVAAQTAGFALLKRFPMLQIRIYDAAANTRIPLK